MNTEELATWVDAQVPLTSADDESPDHMQEVANRLRELQRQIDESTNDQVEALGIIGQLSSGLKANHAEVKKLKDKLKGQKCDTAFWKTRCEKAERDLVLIQHKLNPVTAYSALKVRDGDD